jgi:transcriptional regulator with XRE-family HTH domain
MTGNEAAIAFGEEVRRRRHVQGLTLDELGEAAGLTPEYVGSIEGGNGILRLAPCPRSLRGWAPLSPRCSARPG